MRRCRTCGRQNDMLATACSECGADPRRPATNGCTPVCTPIAGYITLPQLELLAAEVDDAGSSMGVEKRRPPISWFMVSMGAVKLTGIAVTCLTIALLTIAVAKAFM